MALYLPEYNTLFLHCPKTGGSFVAHTLEKTLDLKVEHVGYKHSHKDLVGTIRYRRHPYTFSFVRHPLDWYRSYWQMKMRKKKHWYYWQPKSLWHPNWAIDPKYGDDDFAGFIEAVTQREGYLRDMYRLYTGRGTSDEVHFIGKQESLIDDLRTVFDTVGIPYRADQLLTLEKVNAARSASASYTPELEAMVLWSERGTLADYEYDGSGVPAVAPPHRERGTRTMTAPPPTPAPTDFDSVPGWFRPLDQGIFRAILDWQTANEPAGDLVEMGSYVGKSAILMGEHLKPGETFTVCDLFGMAPPDTANAAESARSYASLDRAAFERNYLAFHDTLPVVLQMPTSQILEHVKPNTARFVHVDASHLYEHVVGDIDAARTILRPGGVVVFDDFQSLHTPGVAAAVWGAMTTAGLKPFAITQKKWYGTWDDPTDVREMLRAWAQALPGHRVEAETIAGHEVLRIIPPSQRRGRAKKTAAAGTPAKPASAAARKG